MRIADPAFPALALAWAGLVTGVVAARACEAAVHYTFNEPVEIEGVLKSGIGHHEAQGEFFYSYLVLDQPVCVDAPKEGADGDFGTAATEKPVDRIQVGGEASQRGSAGGRGARHSEGHPVRRPYRLARRAGADRR